MLEKVTPVLASAVPFLPFLTTKLLLCLNSLKRPMLTVLWVRVSCSAEASGSLFDCAHGEPLAQRRGRGGSGGSDLAPRQLGQAVTPLLPEARTGGCFLFFTPPTFIIKVFKYFTKLEQTFKYLPPRDS